MELTEDIDCPQFYDFTTNDISPTQSDQYFERQSKVYGDKLSLLVSPEENKASDYVTSTSQDPKKDVVLEKKQSVDAAEPIPPPQVMLEEVNTTPTLKSVSSLSQHSPSPDVDFERNEICDFLRMKKKSKSMGELNKIAEAPVAIVQPNPHIETNFNNKRSMSAQDLRPRKKAYPTTPMCLKRTQQRAKPKMKSSEELELEKIAQLQKKLADHLKSNRERMRKMNAKQVRKPAVASNAPKTAPTFRRPLNYDTGCATAAENVPKKVADVSKSCSRITRKAAVSEAAPKLDISPSSSCSTSSNKSGSFNRFVLRPSSKLNCSENRFEKSTGSACAKLSCHPGVSFSSKKRTKSTVVQPFNFVLPSTLSKTKKLSTSMQDLSAVENEAKENVSDNRPVTGKKINFPLKRSKTDVSKTASDSVRKGLVFKGK